MGKLMQLDRLSVVYTSSGWIATLNDAYPIYIILSIT